MEDTVIDLSLQKFAEDFDRDRHKYLKFAFRFVHTPAIVEDLVNDGFAKFWEKRHSLPDDTNIEAYFYTIIKHNCLNWLRNKEAQYRIQNQIFDTSYRLLQYDIATLESYDPSLIFTNEIREILQAQLDKMPELTCKMFMDNRFSNLSYEQIAKKYDVSIWKVTRDIQIVMSALRISLQDYLPVGVITWLCADQLKDLY